MLKNNKLIFFRNGKSDYDKVFYEWYEDGEVFRHQNLVNAWVGSLDQDAMVYGILNSLKDFNALCDDGIFRWHDTRISTFLNHSSHWNEEEQKWDIYFVEDDGLHNIQEYTDKILRKEHNIEKMYLNGRFSDKPIKNKDFEKLAENLADTWSNWSQEDENEQENN